MYLLTLSLEDFVKVDSDDLPVDGFLVRVVEITPQTERSFLGIRFCDQSFDDHRVIWEFQRVPATTLVQRVPERMINEFEKLTRGAFWLQRIAMSTWKW